MTNWMRGPFSAAGMTLLALALAGCSMGSTPRVADNGAPAQLNPVQNSTVSTGALPPLAGTATVAQIAPGLTGTPVLGGVQAQSPLPTPSSTLLASAENAPSLTGGRDLTGVLTTDKLLGGWTVSGAQQSCRLNLTNTTKDGTTRYRASAPACAITALGGVASWTLLGSQVQLFDEAGTMIAALQLSGGKFIGTVAGGTAITMSA